MKVICIDDTVRDGTGSKHPLITVGETYEIIGSPDFFMICFLAAIRCGECEDLVCLAGVPNMLVGFEKITGLPCVVGDMGFYADRFRPVDGEPIIEMFRDMARETTREREDA